MDGLPHTTDTILKHYRRTDLFYVTVRRKFYTLGLDFKSSRMSNREVLRMVLKMKSF